MQVRTLLTDAIRLLQPASDSAQADAEILLAHCLQKTRTWLYTWPEYVVENSVINCFKQVIFARQDGVPIAYLTGQREFWTLNLKVTSATLIPRPETELLVETALTKLPYEQTLNVLDLGTGTGAIALAIAQARPQVQVLATDYSASALTVASENAQLNRIANIRFQQSAWFAQLTPQLFHLIVSNPPYIAANDPHLSQGDVRFEPLSALVAGDNGLSDIKQIITQAPRWLTPQGWLVLEHGYQQGDLVTHLLCSNGFTQVDCLPDLAGNPRVSLGQWQTL